MRTETEEAGSLARFRYDHQTYSCTSTKDASLSGVLGKPAVATSAKKRSKSFNSPPTVAHHCRTNLKRRISFDESFVCELCRKSCSQVNKILLFTRFDLHASPINWLKTERTEECKKNIKDWTRERTHVACNDCLSLSTGLYLLHMQKETEPKDYTVQLLDDLKAWVRTQNYQSSHRPTVCMVPNEDAMKSIISR